MENVRLEKESDRQLILAVINTSDLEHLHLDRTNVFKVRQKSEISIDGFSTQRK